MTAAVSLAVGRDRFVWASTLHSISQAFLYRILDTELGGCPHISQKPCFHLLELGDPGRTAKNTPPPHAVRLQPPNLTDDTMQSEFSNSHAFTRLPVLATEGRFATPQRVFSYP